MKQPALGWIFAAALLVAGSAQAAPAAQGTGQSGPAGRPGEASAERTAGEQRAPSGFFEIVFSGGVIGISIMVLLICLSIAMVALVVENLFTIRRNVLIPPALEETAAKQLAAGNAAAVDQACRQQPSFLAFVLRAGLGEVEGGWPAVEKAMEDALSQQSARLMRRIEYLAVIGNIAPMMGLLGTVVGMVIAFREVAETQGAARAADLASGIYQALVTTVAGLIIAIPSLGALAIFRNRVDQFVAEAAYAAQHIMRPLKRMRVRKAGAPAMPRAGES
jgi:biopolymer transport protein ExbB